MLDYVETVLGDRRAIERRYDDGSVTCPFCSYPIRPSEAPCPNPCCDAHPAWKPEALREHRASVEAKRVERERDEQSRRISADFARTRASEHEEWRAAQVAEARRRGACLHCLFQPGWQRVKFIRHRKACPKTRDDS